jgi:hypothetical protein
MFIRTSRLWLAHFVTNDAKRLLQQYRPSTAATADDRRGCFQGYCRRAFGEVGAQILTRRNLGRPPRSKKMDEAERILSLV